MRSTSKLILLGVVIFIVICIGPYLLLATFIVIGLTILICAIIKGTSRKKDLPTKKNISQDTSVNNTNEQNNLKRRTEDTVFEDTDLLYNKKNVQCINSNDKMSSIKLNMEKENQPIILNSSNEIINIEPKTQNREVIESINEATKNNEISSIIESLLLASSTHIKNRRNSETSDNIHESFNSSMIVPEWTHFYVYSINDLDEANYQQKEFYQYFKTEFLKKNCIDIGNNLNYAFILLFGLIEDYKEHRNLALVQEHLSILGANYPKTERYTKNALNQAINGEQENKTTTTITANVSDTLYRFNHERQQPKEKLVQKCKWINNDEKVEVQGITIKRGGFYIGEKFLLPEKDRNSWDNDKSNYMFASVLNPRLIISKEKSSMPIFSSYTDMTPYWRYQYLQWLSGEISIQFVPLEILFLYLHGLEIRMFVDSDATDEQRNDILNIIIELKDPTIKRAEDNYEVRSFFNRFIDCAITKFFTSSPLKYVSEKELYKYNTYQDYQLQQAIGDKRAISCEFAYKLALNKFDFGSIIPLKYEKYIKERFEYYFKRQHPRGIRISRSSYSPDSHYNILNSPITDQTFHPEERYISCTIFESTFNFWEISGNLREYYLNINREFYSYNRYVEDHEGKETLSALFALPDYINISAEEKVVEFKKFLDNIVERNDYAVIEVNEILKRWEYHRKKEKSLHKKYVDSIIKAFNKLEYGIAPNYNIDKKRFSFGDNCIIFAKKETENFLMNNIYARMEVFVQMSAHIISAGGVITDEKNYIRKYIRCQNDCEANQKQLSAYLEWLLLNKQRFDSKLKDIIPLLFNELQRDECCNTLIRLCCIDGDVNSKRVEILKKVLTVFGEDNTDIHSRIHRAFTGELDNFVTIEKNSNATEFSIPGKADITPKFYLDTNKLSEIEQNTRESQEILSKIFNVDESITQPTMPENKKDINIDFLKMLFTKQTWTRSEIQDICQTHDVMLGSILEKLNDYSYSKIDDAVVEDDGELIYVNVEYKEQLI
jgi:hypothetical protein